MAAANEAFVDYYEMLRVSPGAEVESIQRVHRALAARYHPDNTETGNLERFLKINEAFKVLSAREHLMFTIWYLKAKRFVAQDDRSSLMITAEGIDFMEANLPEHKTMHKLI